MVDSSKEEDNFVSEKLVGLSEEEGAVSSSDSSESDSSSVESSSDSADSDSSYRGAWHAAVKELTSELRVVIPDDSRWRCIRNGKVVSSDRLGDFFIMRFRRLVIHFDFDIDDIIPLVFSSVKLLLEYESEPRQLVRLAHTGRATDLVERLHRNLDPFFQAQDIFASEPPAVKWQSQLLKERRDRLKHYQVLLADSNAFKAQIQSEIDHDQEDGEFQYFLELMTVLKHDYLTYSENLLPSERDVLLAVSDRVSALSGINVVTLPKWFVPPLETASLGDVSEWRGGFVSVDYESANKNKAGFVAGVKQWVDLNHPHIAKLYGACHVGKRFYVHEAPDPDGISSKRRDIWRLIYQCALGLWYLVERGMPYRAFSLAMVAKSSNQDKFMLLHGVGMAVSSSAAERATTPSVSDLSYLAKAVWPRLRPDDADFELSRASVDRVCPASLTDSEWSVLTAMIKTDENDKAAILCILQQLQQLAGASEAPTRKSLIGQHKQLRDAVVPSTSLSFELLFLKLREFFSSDADENEHFLDLAVFKRLVALYDQLQDQLCSSLSPELLTSFINVAARFYRTTVMRNDQSASSVFSALSESCAVRTIASKNYSYHHELDRVVAFPIVDGSDPVHDWKPRWSDFQRQLVQQSPLSNNIGSSCPSMAVLTVITESQDDDEHEPCEEKSSGSSDKLLSDASLDERAVLTRFEATKRRGAYSSAALEPLDFALSRSTRSVVVPEWFIPSYEIELGEFLGQGSFGAVYRGKWFDTDVVIKILLKDTPEQRRDFVREADVWFALNHPNVVHLFGACHVGPRPFFVCEFAGRWTLNQYRSHSSYDDDMMSFYLHAMAAGLQSLHEHGIVHGDLKGNNILLDEDSLPKLADFGLSRFVRDDDEEESDGVGALGAYRWKAPECLSGSRPTFASDVFSLAMCIIEAKTGEYPWGTMDDAVVKFHVKRGALPDRPECFSNYEWDLVTRMCCFDPSERIDMAEVVQRLDRWRRAA
jgi:hypothetical protein